MYHKNEEEVKALENCLMEMKDLTENRSKWRIKMSVPFQKNYLRT